MHDFNVACLTIFLACFIVNRFSVFSLQFFACKKSELDRNPKRQVKSENRKPKTFFFFPHLMQPTCGN